MALSRYLFASNDERIAEVRRGPGRGYDGEEREGLSVIILNLNQSQLILPLLARLATERKAFADRDLFFEVIVGDTGSTELELLRQYEVQSQAQTLKVVHGLIYHFSKNNNELADTLARGTHLLFLNNDVIFPDEGQPLLQLYEYLRREAARVGVVGAYLRFPDQSVQHAGVAFVPEGEQAHLPYHFLAHEHVPESLLRDKDRVGAVTGACLMIRRKLFANLGGFDENYAKECQDIALCLAARRLSWETAILNVGPVVHIENASRPKGDESRADRSRFLRKWAAFIEALKL